MTDYEKTARVLLQCTCLPELPQKMRDRGDHFANCPAELVPDVAAALERACEEGFSANVSALRHAQRRKVWRELLAYLLDLPESNLDGLSVAAIKRIIRRICGLNVPEVERLEVRRK